MAEINDMARVALESGNSLAIINRHYKQLVTSDAAKAWFAVQPPIGRKIVEMVARLYPEKICYRETIDKNRILKPPGRNLPRKRIGALSRT